MASNQHLLPRRAQEFHCRMCGAPCTVAGLPAHARSHGQQARSASSTARQCALRAKARALLLPSKAERTAALRAKAHALLRADDWKVYFTARRRLIHLQNERSSMGFELFGDPTAFR